jgi:hypothetical protein
MVKSERSPWKANEQVEQDLIICRALYQKKKRRDLYDLFKALKSIYSLSTEKIIQVFLDYMKHEVTDIPSKESYLKNLEDKMKDPEFLGDTTALRRPDETYDPNEEFDLLKKEIIERM